MKKLLDSENNEIRAGIEKLVTGNFEIHNDIPKKLRCVDPPYFNESGVLKRLSDNNMNFLNTIHAHVKK